MLVTIQNLENSNVSDLVVMMWRKAQNPSLPTKVFPKSMCVDYKAPYIIVLL